MEALFYLKSVPISKHLPSSASESLADLSSQHSLCDCWPSSPAHSMREDRKIRQQLAEHFVWRKTVVFQSARKRGGGGGRETLLKWNTYDHTILCMGGGREKGTLLKWNTHNYTMTIQFYAWQYISPPPPPSPSLPPLSLPHSLQSTGSSYTINCNKQNNWCMSTC